MYTHMCVSGEKIHRTVREMRVPVYVDTGYTHMVTHRSFAQCPLHCKPPTPIIRIILLSLLLLLLFFLLLLLIKR